MRIETPSVPAARLSVIGIDGTPLPLRVPITLRATLASMGGDRISGGWRGDAHSVDAIEEILEGIDDTLLVGVEGEGTDA